eukprot:TRINITY_DN5423_c0_g1_i1.p1 TRINITY_DN5423_c0_g1~~TRINITY_DN5423_c0_g1_i1.p1  ORF type:complete len:435 (-),score=72.14 TRINITY_DN5423_c0_g1_i1:30-1334(-)
MCFGCDSLYFNANFQIQARRPGNKPRGVTRYPCTEMKVKNKNKNKKEKWSKSYGPVYPLRDHPSYIKKEYDEEFGDRSSDNSSDNLSDNHSSSSSSDSESDIPEIKAKGSDHSNVTLSMDTLRIKHSPVKTPIRIVFSAGPNAPSQSVTIATRTTVFHEDKGLGSSYEEKKETTVTCNLSHSSLEERYDGEYWSNSSRDSAEDSDTVTSKKRKGPESPRSEAPKEKKLKTLSHSEDSITRKREHSRNTRNSLSASFDMPISIACRRNPGKSHVPNVALEPNTSLAPLTAVVSNKNSLTPTTADALQELPNIPQNSDIAFKSTFPLPEAANEKPKALDSPMARTVTPAPINNASVGSPYFPHLSNEELKEKFCKMQKVRVLLPVEESPPFVLVPCELSADIHNSFKDPFVWPGARELEQQEEEEFWATSSGFDCI